MSMFKPTLKITIHPSLKTYSVEATVLVPNGCYSAAGATLGVPDGHVIIPEAEGVTLNIIKSPGPCTEAIKTLYFKIERIPLTAGKSSVIAFSSVDDNVLGVGSAAIPRIGDQESLTVSQHVPSGVVIHSVNGWINAMPPGPRRLISIVNVWAPCMNYEYSFTDRGPFGFTGRTLLIELKATLPDACLKAIYEGPVRFDRNLADEEQFDSIALMFEGELHVDPLETVY